MSNEIPGPSGRWLVGSFGQINMEQLHVALYDFKKTYGNVFQFFVFTQRIIVISDVELLQKVFNTQQMCYRPDNFLNGLKYEGSGYLDSNFSEKDVMLKSVLWKAISTVQSDDVVAKLCQKEVDKFTVSLESCGDISVLDGLMATIARQYSTVLIGTEAADKHGDAVTEYLDSVYALYSGGKMTLLTKIPWLQYLPGSFKSATERLLTARQEIAPKLVADARKVHRIGKEHGILQHLLTASKREENDLVITEENLVACTMDLVFNMVIPTVHNVAYILLQAIEHPDIQQKIHDELDKVGKAKRTDEIRPADVPYLEAFVLECMRYLSLVNISFPHYVNETTTIDGFTFPEGATVFGDTFGIHHDEHLWEEPWELNPGRFLDEVGKCRPNTDPVRKNLFHFGYGVRACRGPHIAMEKILSNVLGILTKYKVTLADNSEKPPTDPREYGFNIAIKMPDFKCIFTKK